MNGCRILFAMAVLFILNGLILSQANQPGQRTYRVVKVLPHDPQAFTLGLVFEDGFLYEGTGQYGESTLREVQPENGKVVRAYELPAHLFGEGIGIVNNRIYQLTWQAGLCLVFDKHDFRLLKTIYYSLPKEGWGMTYNGRDLIVSDGSATLYFLDPKTLKLRRRLPVHYNGRPIHMLNELEFVGGKIYANIWQQSHVVVVDEDTGKVKGWLDISKLVPKHLKGHIDYVLNGIAYNRETKHFYITGKMWPKMYVLEIQGGE